MKDENYPAKTNLAFGKIVSTPTLSSWSQAYSAGSLFAVVSLNKNEEDGLAAIGKEIINALEEEYFTLEEKNLGSIKKAILATYKKVPEGVSCSLVVIAVIKNVLYAFIGENGKILLRRNEKIGRILSGGGDRENPVSSSSGYLENNDLVILETKPFTEIISAEELLSSFDHLSPSEIAENLTPLVHKKERGDAAAILVCYQQPEEVKERIEPRIMEEAVPKTEEKPSESLTPIPRFRLPNLPKLPSFPNLNHSKKLLLSIALILAFVLIASVYFTKQKQEQDKIKTAFEAVYPVASKKYNEGQSLLGLNKNLARDSFLQAQKILNENTVKFKKDSKEEKQINELLIKINQAAEQASEINSVDAREINPVNSLMLSAEAKNPSASYVYQDGKTIYLLTSDSVLADGKEKIKNKDFWQAPGALGIYLGNIYVLDKKDGILKFVSGEAANKASYFASGVNPDLSKAVSMSIDGSIYILLSDGNLLKFTRGKADTFNISSLDKPFSSPSRIYTTVDQDKIYILDNGNSRIVVLDKKGTYSSQYSSKILKDAKDFEVLEKEKKIYVLSQGKIWEISLK